MKNRATMALALMLLAAVTSAVQAMTGTTITEQLRGHVQVLAGEIGERHVWRPQALHRAADYVRASLTAQGHVVREQRYRLNELGEWANLEVELAGATRAQEIVVIGAHYDTVTDSPGANDNGSGVAALLELARAFAGHKPQRTLRFVAFVNEEPPFFYSGRMGSRVYAKRAHKRGEQIVAMLSLETIGYYRDEPGSQHYPPFFRWFYPDRGNFIALVANFRSRTLMREVAAAFRAASDFPLEHVATFALVPGVNWSDHDSFWREGYPALMVTDTALYRYPHYHSPSDTPDKLDYPRLARVTEGLEAVVRRLANPDADASR